MDSILGIMFCLVVGVTDGDTIKVLCGDPDFYQQINVRLVAVDAPEYKYLRADKTQPFGNRSRQHLRNLCINTNAKITAYSKDQYGRLVAAVECNGKDAGTEQVSSGMAWVYDHYAKEHEYLYPFQENARATRQGLWADKDPVPPWVWRRANRAQDVAP